MFSQAGKTAANEGGRLMRDFKLLRFGQIWSLRVGTKMDHKKHFSNMFSHSFSFLCSVRATVHTESKRDANVNAFSLVMVTFPEDETGGV